MMTTRLLSKKGLTYMKALELSQGFKTTMNSDSPVPLCAVEMGGEAAGRLLVMGGETTAGWLLVMGGETAGRLLVMAGETAGWLLVMAGETAGRLLVMAGETAGRLLVMAGETTGRFPITGGEVRHTDSMLMSPWCKPSSVTPSDINIAGLRSIVPVC